MKLKDRVIQVGQIIEGNVKRLFNIPVKNEDVRLTICSTCPINKDSICSKELGGCGCPIKSKVKCVSCRCPLLKW